MGEPHVPVARSSLMAKLTMPCTVRVSNNVPSGDGTMQVSIEVDAKFSPASPKIDIAGVTNGGPATHEFHVNDLAQLLGSKPDVRKNAQYAHDLLTAVNLHSSRAIWMDMPSASLPPIYEQDPLPSPPTEVHQEGNTVHVRAHLALGVSVSGRAALRTQQVLVPDEVVSRFLKIQNHRASKAPNPVLSRALENFMRGCNSINWDSQVTAWWASIEQAAGVLGEATSGRGLVAAAASRSGLSVGDIDNVRIVNNRIKHGSTGTKAQEQVYAAYKLKPGNLAAIAHSVVRPMVAQALP